MEWILKAKFDKSLIDVLSNPKQKYVFDFLSAGKDHIFERVVAEGVEDKATLDLLTELDVDTIQGYYFSKPLTKSEMEDFYLDFNSAKIT